MNFCRFSPGALVNEQCAQPVTEFMEHFCKSSVCFTYSFCLFSWLGWKACVSSKQSQGVIFQAELSRATLQNVSFHIFLWFSFCILVPCSIWERQTEKHIHLGLWQDRSSVAGCSEHLTGHKKYVEKRVLILYSCFHFKIVLFENENQYLNEEKVFLITKGLKIFQIRHQLHADYLCVCVMGHRWPCGAWKSQAKILIPLWVGRM